MSEPTSSNARCPFCGNDRVVHVTQSEGGAIDRRSFCAGSLGCRTWWNPSSMDPVALPSGSFQPSGLALQ